jgi:hypothetical protein
MSIASMMMIHAVAMSKLPDHLWNSCIWMQTLPNTMQANILAFLSVEHLHFQYKDLHALASCLLASNNVDFWVKCGVANLLRTLQQHNSEGYPCFPGTIPQALYKLPK